MGRKRLAEVLAMLMIGNGLEGWVDTRRHTALWQRGTRTYPVPVCLSHPVIVPDVDPERPIETGMGSALASRQRPRRPAW